MKKLLVFSLALLLLLLIGRVTSAQDCGVYYDLRKGGTYELTTFDARDQPTGRIVQEVRQVETSAGKTTAVIHQEFFDKNNKPTSFGDYTVECQAGMVRLDMRAMLNPQATAGPGGPAASMKAEVTGDLLELPTTLKPGAQLKNGTMTATMRDAKSGMALSTTTINVSNRRVEGTETIRTAAGSFACTKR